MSLSVASADSSRPRIIICLNARRLWLWHTWLCEALAGSGQTFEVRLIDSGPPLPGAIKTLLTLEHLLYGLSGEHACDLVDASELSGANTQPSGVIETGGTILNLSGSDLPGVFARKPGLRILCPFFDGLPTEDSLISTLLEEHIPELTIQDANQPNLIWHALPAVENRRVLTSALDNIFSTLMRLCIKALVDADRSVVPLNVSTPPVMQTRPISWSALQFETKVVASKAAAKLTGLCTVAPRWSTGWRWTTDDRAHLTFQLPSSDYHRIRDDGRRCYADPFVIGVEGLRHIFVEEFDYALGRGVISTTSIGANGQTDVPHVVVERPYHLSYPFVLEHDGHIWMIPESSAARTVELYRADPFPDRWVLEATLLNDISVADATVFFHEARWWMFASTVERQSSSWDALSIFHARDLLGPWFPHPQNPVLIDSRSARPAGNIFYNADTLWRPAQDCSVGYGSAIALCSIDTLDTENYAQTTKAFIGPGSFARRIHTLNWAAGLEVIDGWG